MKQVQDTVIQNVQHFIRTYFDDSLTQSQIEEINQELEVKILASFYEHGIASNPKAYKQ